MFCGLFTSLGSHKKADVNYQTKLLSFRLKPPQPRQKVCEYWWHQYINRMEQKCKILYVWCLTKWPLTPPWNEDMKVILPDIGHQLAMIIVRTLTTVRPPAVVAPSTVWLETTVAPSGVWLLRLATVLNCMWNMVLHFDSPHVYRSTHQVSVSMKPVHCHS